jgi:hypothetical protein
MSEFGFDVITINENITSFDFNIKFYCDENDNVFITEDETTNNNETLDLLFKFCKIRNKPPL